VTKATEPLAHAEGHVEHHSHNMQAPKGHDRLRRMEPHHRPPVDEKENDARYPA